MTSAQNPAPSAVYPSGDERVQSGSPASDVVKERGSDLGDSRDLSQSAGGPLPVANHEALQDLLRRVESATGADRELDRDLFMALVPCDRAPFRYWAPVDEHNGHGEPREGWVYYAPHCGQAIEVPAYTASLDAALALVERCDPGFKWRVAAYTPAEAQACGIDRAERPFWATCGLPSEQEQATGKTPALALLAALLRALNTKEEGR